MSSLTGGFVVAAVSLGSEADDAVLDRWQHPEAAETLRALGEVRALDRSKQAAHMRRLVAHSFLPIAGAPERPAARAQWVAARVAAASAGKLGPELPQPLPLRDLGISLAVRALQQAPPEGLAEFCRHLPPADARDLVLAVKRQDPRAPSVDGPDARQTAGVFRAAEIVRLAATARRSEEAAGSEPTGLLIALGACALGVGLCADADTVDSAAAACPVPFGSMLRAGAQLAGFAFSPDECENERVWLMQAIGRTVG
jgi:hypothetical protein